MPDYNVGVVVLSNTAADQITEFGESTTRIALGGEAGPSKSSKPSKSSSAVAVGPDVLKRYEGVYAITPQFAMTIRQEGKGLTVQATGQQKIRLVAGVGDEIRLPGS
ncbi:MAG: hypothetical protein R3C10_11755 [Pirellulales bacterium]